MPHHTIALWHFTVWASLVWIFGIWAIVKYYSIFQVLSWRNWFPSCIASVPYHGASVTSPWSTTPDVTWSIGSGVDWPNSWRSTSAICSSHSPQRPPSCNTEMTNTRREMQAETSPGTTPNYPWSAISPRNRFAPVGSSRPTLTRCR